VRRPAEDDALNEDPEQAVAQGESIGSDGGDELRQ
jgi:hypothetical protein